MKILVISENIPKRNFSSGDRRFLGILEILASKHDVTFCIPNKQPWLKPEETKQHTDHLQSMGIRFLPFNERWYERTLKTEKYDIGFFEFFWIAEKSMVKFIRWQPQATVIVDSVDIHFAREQTQHNLGQISKSKVLWTKHRELSVYRLADIVVAVSDEDLGILKNKKKLHEVELIANVVPGVKRTLNERDPILIFIGCYAWPPNADGILWFVEKIWPFVIAQKPDAKLMIVGSQPTEEILNLAQIEGIEVTGFVTDTLPYLDKAAISIAPLRYGGGMKGKVNEAFAHGLPVVATTIGAQGFDVKNGEEMFVADSPEEFAKAVMTLLDNPELQQEMGLAGQALNEKKCSPKAIEKALDALVMKSEMKNGSVSVFGIRSLKVQINKLINPIIKKIND